MQMRQRPQQRLVSQTSKCSETTCALDSGCIPDRELASPKELSAKGSCEVSGVMPPSGCRLSPSLCKGLGDSRASLADQLRPNTWARRSFWLTCCSKPTTGGPASSTSHVKLGQPIRALFHCRQAGKLRGPGMLQCRSKTRMCCTDHGAMALYKIHLLDSWKMKQFVTLALSAYQRKPQPSCCIHQAAAVCWCCELTHT